MRTKMMIAILTICLLVWQCCAFAAGKEWSPEEKLAKQTKPAVVRIYAFYWATWTIGNVQINSIYGGSGSGAFIHPDGYIVTNAHVVDAYTHDDNKKWRNLALNLVDTLVNKYGLSRGQAIAIINSKVAQIGKITSVYTVITPGGEELPFDLKEIGSPAGEKDGKDVAVIKVEGRNFPTIKLGDSDKINTGEKIYVAGYPGDGDLGSWGNRKSTLEWSWAPGSISSDRKASSLGAPLIQVNAEGVKPGNSGGPILNGQGQVIGLLTFGTPGGPHWGMASRTVQEFIRKAGTVNESGLADKAYSEGLVLYWQGYYSKALAKFEEVKRLYPKHSEAEGLIAECQNNIAQGNDRKYWPDYYPYLAGAAALLLAVAAGYIIRRRKVAANFKNTSNT